MKVSDIGPGKATTPTRRKKATTGKGAEFADQLREAAAVEAGGTVDPSAATAVDSVLAVQEVPHATDERSRGLFRHYGETLLDRLDQIRHDLLIGAVPKERLADLAHTMRQQKSRSDDPHLNEIIDEIELRASVEIAKLTRGP